SGRGRACHSATPTGCSPRGPPDRERGARSGCSWPEGWPRPWAGRQPPRSTTACAFACAFPPSRRKRVARLAGHLAPMDPAEALRILEEERERGSSAFASASSLEELERAHTEILGRKSRWSEVQRGLGGFADEDRRTIGR